MILFEVNNIEEAISNLKYFASYKPYQYSGRWFIAFLGGECIALRTKKGLQVRAAKLGLTEFEMWQYGK